MRIVFMGTPEFAAIVLERLAAEHDVAAVYTRPDAVRGRGRRLEPSPVKRAAERFGLEVRTPRTLRDEDVRRELASFEPDVVCVAAYGAILPKEVLDLPTHGCLNVHASLLPRWRGAAPVERAILAGDETAGVCIMRMEEGLDTGAYCACRETDASSKDAHALTAELARLGAEALLESLRSLEAGSLAWIEQDESVATYARKVEKGELDLRLSDSSDELCRKVRASSEAHPSHARIAGKKATVLELAKVADEAGAAQTAGLPVGGVRFAAKRLYLGAADGAVEMLRVKPEGKQAMDAKAFAAGVQGIKAGGLTWEAIDG